MQKVSRMDVNKAGIFFDALTRFSECVQTAEAQCKVGVHWDNLHLLCHRTLCEEFLRLGIFKNASVDEIVRAGLTQAFYPHGLGK
jgi:Xaa-Pro aminopeptidase